MATTDISPFRARSGADDASPRPPAAPTEPARPRTLPSHPFGDLIKQHLSRRHGLSQSNPATVRKVADPRLTVRALVEE